MAIAGEEIHFKWLELKYQCCIPKTNDILFNDKKSRWGIVKNSYNRNLQQIFKMLTALGSERLLKNSVKTCISLLYKLKILKGKVQRDFFTPVFFTKRLIPVSIDMLQSDFEIFRIFAELFEHKL
jgi:hypothetical protein